MLMQARSGSVFHYKDFNNRKSVINIEDIATVMSRIPWHLGHTQDTLSSARHAIVLAKMTEFVGGPGIYGLLHHAQIVYTGLVPAGFVEYIDEKTMYEQSKTINRMRKRIYKGLEILPPTEGDLSCALLADGWVNSYERLHFFDPPFRWHTDTILDPRVAAKIKEMYDQNYLTEPYDDYVDFLNAYAIYFRKGDN